MMKELSAVKVWRRWGFHALTVGILAATCIVATPPARADVLRPHFQCFEDRIYMQSPIVRSSSGGASNDIVWWRAELVGYSAETGEYWRYFGDWHLASLFGGSTILGWTNYVTRERSDAVDVYNVRPGQYFVFNHVYSQDSGTWDGSYSINENFILNPGTPGEDEYWCMKS